MMDSECNVSHEESMNGNNLTKGISDWSSMEHLLEALRPKNFFLEISIFRCLDIASAHIALSNRAAAMRTEVRPASRKQAVRKNAQEGL